MIKIDSVEFGSIVIDGVKYSQVLIIGDKATERDCMKLKEKFATSHKIGDWEKTQLWENNPEIIVIGTGWDGVTQVEESFVEQAKEKGIALLKFLTPEAVEFYNQKTGAGIKINALIHTTC